MLSAPLRDRARQALNLLGALFQVGMTAYAATAIQSVVDDTSARSPVEPAGYAFAIWGLIFGLSLAYAAYQALPAQREDPLLRRVGWWTAGAFVGTGLWSVFVPRRRTDLALAVFLLVWGCLATAFLRATRGPGSRDPSRAERWLVSLPIGVFLGWVTAADAVSLHSEAVRAGLVGGAGLAGEILGGGLLLAAGLVAAGLILAGRAGPPLASLAFAATILWAVVGIVVNQWDVSPPTTAAALLAAVPVAVALLRRTPRRPPGRSVDPLVSSAAI